MSTSRNATPITRSQVQQTADALRPAWSNSSNQGQASQQGPPQPMPQFDRMDAGSAALDQEAVPSSIFAASRKLQGSEGGPTVFPAEIHPGQLLSAPSHQQVSSTWRKI